MPKPKQPTEHQPEDAPRAKQVHVAYDPAFALQAEKLTRLGLTDAQLADVLGCHRSTLYVWQERHAEFAAAIRNGKALADAEVSESLYKRARGYEAIEADGRTKHVPPDTVACIFWLKNRQPHLWRDKRDLEHSGSIGTSHEAALDALK